MVTVTSDTEGVPTMLLFVGTGVGVVVVLDGGI